MKFGRANYPSTTLLLNVHVDRFPGIVVLHHLRLQEERDEGCAGKVKPALQHRKTDVSADVKSVSIF